MVMRLSTGRCQCISTTSALCCSLSRDSFWAYAGMVIRDLLRAVVTLRDTISQGLLKPVLSSGSGVSISSSTGAFYICAGCALTANRFLSERPRPCKLGCHRRGNRERYTTPDTARRVRDQRTGRASFVPRGGPLVLANKASLHVRHMPTHICVDQSPKYT